MSKDKLIPELRFPEFQNQGEWEKDSIDNQFDLQDGCPFSSFDFTKDIKDSKQVIRITDINNQNSNEEKVYLPNSKIKDLEISKYEVHSGDLLLSLTGAAGFNFFIWNTYSGFINQRTMKISPKKQDNEALKFLLEPLIHSKINSIGTGQNNNLSKDALKEIEFPFPKPKEQRKLSSFITNLNDLLAAHSQKLELLKDYKKGLMQNLFPQEGVKVPKYRFKEFEKDGEWQDKKLGDLTEIKGRIGYRGYTLEDIVGKGEGAISMSPSNINEFGTLSFTKSTYITWAKYEESPEIMLENGFTVLVKTGSTYGKVAFIKNLTEKTTINPQLVVLKPKKVNNYFLYLLVANASIQKQINATVVGGAIPTLSQESISNFEILVPKIKEQEKIAECLSSLNDLIISQTEKIEQLKLHKKGLMQGLFPKIQD